MFEEKEYDPHGNTVDIPARKVVDSEAVFAANLLNQIQTGDQRAEAEFVKVYSDILMSILLSDAHDPDIARDCYQITLMIALKKIRAGDIRKPESVLAFLSRTAANVVITHHRTEKRYASLGDRVYQLPGQVEDVAALEKDTEIVKFFLKKILNLLSVPRDREILQRFYLYDEDKKSICRDFVIKPEHFDRVLYRAKQRLRLLLESQRDIRAILHNSLGVSQVSNAKCSAAQFNAGSRVGKRKRGAQYRVRRLPA